MKTKIFLALLCATFCLSHANSQSRKNPKHTSDFPKSVPASLQGILKLSNPAFADLPSQNMSKTTTKKVVANFFEQGWVGSKWKDTNWKYTFTYDKSGNPYQYIITYPPTTYFWGERYVLTRLHEVNIRGFSTSFYAAHNKGKLYLPESMTLQRQKNGKWVDTQMTSFSYLKGNELQYQVQRNLVNGQWGDSMRQEYFYDSHGLYLGYSTSFPRNGSWNAMGGYRFEFIYAGSHITAVNKYDMDTLGIWHGGGALEKYHYNALGVIDYTIRNYQGGYKDSVYLKWFNFDPTNIIENGIGIMVGGTGYTQCISRLLDSNNVLVALSDSIIQRFTRDSLLQGTEMYIYDRKIDSYVPWSEDSFTYYPQKDVKVYLTYSGMATGSFVMNFGTKYDNIYDAGNSLVESVIHQYTSDSFMLICRDMYSYVNVTGIDEASVKEEKMSVYPNPAGDIVNVMLPEMNSVHGNISLYSMQGDLMMTQHTSSSQVQVDISSLPKGMYIMEYNNAEIKSRGRIVKL